MIQFHTDKIATRLEPNSTVLYTVEILLLNLTKKYCWYKIDNGRTFVGIWPTSTAEHDQDISIAKRMESKMSLV